MGRLVLAIIAFLLAMAVLKMVIIALVIAGLIFRTKETIGLLALGAFLTGLQNAPLPTLGIVAALVIISLIFKAREKKAAARALEPPDVAEPALPADAADP